MSRLRRLLPSLNGLFAFDAVVRCGTFARAAEDLGLTAPAISRSISRLEAHLGFRLFHRTPTGAELSDQGRLIHDALRRGFAGIENAVDEARAAPDAPQVVTFSVTSAFANHWFVPRLSQFQAAFPNVEVQFDLLRGILTGPTNKTDISMRFDPIPGEHEVLHPLMPEIILPVVAPGLITDTGSGNFPVPVKRLLTLANAATDWPSLCGDRMPQHEQDFVSPDYSLVLQAALMGEGMAPGWMSVVSYLMVREKLVPVQSGALRTRRTCCLVRRRGPGGALAGQICDWIIRMIHEDVAILDQRYPNLGLAFLVQDRSYTDWLPSDLMAARKSPATGMATSRA